MGILNIFLGNGLRLIMICMVLILFLTLNKDIRIGKPPQTDDHRLNRDIEDNVGSAPPPPENSSLVKDICVESVGLYSNGKDAVDWFGYRSQLITTPSIISNFVSSPDLQISYARSTKVASTTMVSILAYLSKSYANETVDAFLKRYPTVFDQEKWYHNEPITNHAQFFNSTWLKLFIIRDPVQRFLSAWRFSCELPERANLGLCCQKNVTCYLTELYQRLHFLSHVPERFGTEWPGKPAWFTNRFVERHFFPQTWYYGISPLAKGVREDMVTVILYQSKTFISDLLRVLDKHPAIPQDKMTALKMGIDKLHRRPTEGKVTGETYEDIKYKVESDQQLKNCIKKMYATDYQVFGNHFTP